MAETEPGVEQKLPEIDCFNGAANGLNGWWFDNATYSLKFWKKDKMINFAIFNNKTFAKYVSIDINSNYQNDVLFKILSFCQEKKASIKIKEAEEAAMVIISYFQKDLEFTHEIKLKIERVVESKDEVILYKLQQMELAHKEEIKQLKIDMNSRMDIVLELHQSIVLLPGASRIIGINQRVLILDARDMAIKLVQILDDATNKDAFNDENDEKDEKDENDSQFEYEPLLLECGAIKYPQYSNNNQISTNLSPYFQKLGLLARDANGCNSCGNLCNCNVSSNAQYTRNKLLMVFMHSLSYFEKHIKENIESAANYGLNFPPEMIQIMQQLTDVVTFLSNPDIVGYAGGNIRALSGLLCIEELTIQFNDKIVDITPLSKLKTLQKLKIEHCSKVKDVHCIKSLTKLKHLSFYCSQKVADVTKLGDLKKLELLDVRKTKVINLTIFYQYPNLKILFDRFRRNEKKV